MENPTPKPKGYNYPTKKRKTDGKEEKKEILDASGSVVTKAIIQFKSSQGDLTGSELEVPLEISTDQLQVLLNTVLSNDEARPYSFFMNEEEIISDLREIITKQKVPTEETISVVYQPQSLFRVRSVTRCSATIPGHAEAVLHVSFSADGKNLASGSGDATVRIWDVFTQTPRFTCKGHKNWVLAVAWSPDGKLLASGSMDGDVRLWDVETGKAKGKPLTGHKKWITSLAWEPFLTNPKCDRLASSSKDGTIKIWDIVRKQCVLSLSGHTASVNCIRWGGQNLLYSASHDRTIKVWDPVRGILVRTLEGHAHRVNTLSLNTDYVLRIGPYDIHGNRPEDEKEAVEVCRQKYKAVVGPENRELLVSASDDFTLYLWDPTKEKKALTRMTGHQQPVNYILYSPDGQYIASASFDKSVRLWNGTTGKFVAALRAHVQAVYQVCWSADSRLLCSSSKDSTMKTWDVRTKKLLHDLPGHADEVYAVDWSPDGERVASGGKDKVLKIWRR